MQTFKDYLTEGTSISTMMDLKKAVPQLRVTDKRTGSLFVNPKTINSLRTELEKLGYKQTDFDGGFLFEKKGAWTIHVAMDRAQTKAQISLE